MYSPSHAAYRGCGEPSHRHHPSEYRRLRRRLLSVGQQLEVHGPRRRSVVRRRPISQPDGVPALYPADGEARPRSDGRRRQSPVRRHGADRVGTEAVLPVDGENAALPREELGLFARAKRV